MCCPITSSLPPPTRHFEPHVKPTAEQRQNVAVLRLSSPQPEVNKVISILNLTELPTLTSSRRHRRHQVAAEARWLRNVDLAEYLNVSDMCIWRWQRDPALRFPQPTRINNISYTDKQEIDSWMRGRVADLAIRPAKEK